MVRRKIDFSTSGEGNVIDMRTGKPLGTTVLPIIYERIRFYRKAQGVEQKDLARMIGITANAISNWENGRSQPDVNLLPALCTVLNISFYDLFRLDEPFMKYTARQQLLIDQFDHLSNGHKHAVEQMIDTLLKVEIAEECPDIRKLTFYDHRLAASISDPTESDDGGTPIYLYASPEVNRADCVFTVSGNSMEPEFRNGDMVLVRRIPDGPELSFGEIGAFIVGNETYIKVYQEDGLHSLNDGYETMCFSNEEPVYLIGRVIGALDLKSIAKENDVEKYQTIHENDG